MDFLKNKKFIAGLSGILLFSFVLGALGGTLTTYFLLSELLDGRNLFSLRSQEDAITEIARESSPSVVSIIVTKDLPIIERRFRTPNPFDFFNSPFDFFSPPFVLEQKGTEKIEVGGGTGFIISEDGLIITNKHVVEDEDAEYTVLLNNETEAIEAEVLARDPLQDLAVLKIEKNNLSPLKLGDSDNLEIGQTVVAIGNALGEFRNTVSVGVISGLRRSIVAGQQGASSEVLEGVIQTDAAVNSGNSGGPLLNLNGEVIGINVAVAAEAQNIAFALPINSAKRDVEMVKEQGEITFPFLGVNYVMINEAIAQQENLSVNYGALITGGNQEGAPSAVVSGGPADKAGIVENDIILEVDGTKVEGNNNLAKLIQSKKVGDNVTFKILRDGQEVTIRVKLGEQE